MRRPPEQAATSDLNLERCVLTTLSNPLIVQPPAAAAGIQNLFFHIMLSTGLSVRWLYLAPTFLL